MLYGFGYVVGESGEKYWKEFLDFNSLNCLSLPKEKMDSIRKEFSNTQITNFLGKSDYLIKGIYFKFIESDESNISRILVVQGNSKKGIEEAVNEFGLSIHQANLSEQEQDYLSNIKKSIPPGQASPL
jgi:hypothetical protein